MIKTFGTALLISLLMLQPVAAHEWYSEKHDPVTGGLCCGGSDCRQLVIVPGVMTAEADGYRIRLTSDQARKINPYRIEAVDTLVPWARVQPSEDGNFHICIPPTRNLMMKSDFYCFFAPPST
jgi:hypothetical protein